MLYQTRAVNQAFHFSRKQSSFSDEIDSVEYDVPGEESTTYPGRTSLLSAILRLLQEHRVYKRKRTEPQVRILMPLEQKNATERKEIVYISTKPWNLAVDGCVGIFSVSKARRNLPNKEDL